MSGASGSLISRRRFRTYSSELARLEAAQRYMTASLLTVILSWFLAHIYFGLYYMQLYYDDTVLDGKLTYHMGLEFPERATAGFWDFMYYSFTIAMCCQTSDVTVTSMKIPPRHPRARDSFVSLCYRNRRFCDQRNLECYMSAHTRSFCL